MRGKSPEGTFATLLVHGQKLLLFISNLQPKTQKQNCKLGLHFSSCGLSSCFFILDSHQQEQLNVDLDLLHPSLLTQPERKEKIWIYGSVCRPTMAGWDVDPMMTSTAI